MPEKLTLKKRKKTVITDEEKEKYRSLYKKKDLTPEERRWIADYKAKLHERFLEEKVALKAKKLKVKAKKPKAKKPEAKKPKIKHKKNFKPRYKGTSTADEKTIAARRLIYELNQKGIVDKAGFLKKGGDERWRKRKNYWKEFELLNQYHFGAKKATIKGKKEWEAWRKKQKERAHEYGMEKAREVFKKTPAYLGAKHGVVRPLRKVGKAIKWAWRNVGAGYGPEVTEAIKRQKKKQKR